MRWRARQPLPASRPSTAWQSRLARLAAFASALAAAVGAQAAGGSSNGSWGAGPQQKFLSTVAADLKANGGKCVVIPGEQQPASVHLAAIAINQALGNAGKTVVYTETVNPMPSIQLDDIRTLAGDMQAGKVDWLLILDSNPHTRRRLICILKTPWTR